MKRKCASYNFAFYQHVLLNIIFFSLGSAPASFCVHFHLFRSQLKEKNSRLGLNSNCRSRRFVHWPRPPTWPLSIFLIGPFPASFSIRLFNAVDTKYDLFMTGFDPRISGQKRPLCRLSHYPGQTFLFEHIRVPSECGIIINLELILL